MANQEKQRLWNERIEAFLASGLSQAAWCREQGLRENQLGYWLRKRSVAAAALTNKGWIRVHAAMPHKSGVSLRVGSITLEIESDFDGQVLTDVIRSVMALC